LDLSTQSLASGRSAWSEPVVKFRLQFPRIEVVTEAPSRGGGVMSARARSGSTSAIVFFFLAFAGAGRLPAAQTPTVPAEILPLERAVALALEGNRDVKNAALEVVKAESALSSFRTEALPYFNVYAIESQTLGDIKVNVPAGSFGDFPATGPIPATDTEVKTEAGRKGLILAQVSQPLTQLRSVSLGVALKRANLEIAREKLRARRQSVVDDVRRSYYGLLRSQTALHATGESLAALRELDRVVETRVAQKVELQAGSLEVKARLSKAEHDALVQGNDFASGRERLNSLLGRPIEILFEVDPVPEISPYEQDLESARAKALAQRADLREARLRQRQAEIDRKIKKWDFVPDVSLTYSYLSLPSVELLPNHFKTVGLVLSWEPWDWGRRSKALAQARATVEELDNTVREAESQAAIDVGMRFRALQESRALMEATRLGREAARERLKVTTEKYGQKAALLKDVLEDQERLADAGRSYEESLLAAWTARADLEKALGED
jgi:outer membrane protein TolC